MLLPPRPHSARTVHAANMDCPDPSGRDDLGIVAVLAVDGLTAALAAGLYGHVDTCMMVRDLAVGESSVILLHPPLPLVGVSIVMERESVSKMTELLSVASCCGGS